MYHACSSWKAQLALLSGIICIIIFGHGGSNEYLLKSWFPKHMPTLITQDPIESYGVNLTSTLLDVKDGSIHVGKNLGGK